MASTMAVAHAGGDYHGLPNAPEDYARGQRYSVYGTLPNTRRHVLPPPCTLRVVNYVLGWAGVAYRARFFDAAFFDGLGMLAAAGFMAQEAVTGQTWGTYWGAPDF